MKAAFKTRLIKALTSEKYKHCEGALCTRGRYCIMGVVCDLSKKAVGGHWEPGKTKSDAHTFVVGTSSRNQGTAPKKVLIYTGISDALQEVLFGMNDSGMTFKGFVKFLKAMKP